jgi:hypothetical protein
MPSNYVGRPSVTPASSSTRGDGRQLHAPPVGTAALDASQCAILLQHAAMDDNFMHHLSELRHSTLRSASFFFSTW